MCDFYKPNALLEQSFLNYCVFSKEAYNVLPSGGTCKQKLRDTFSSCEGCSHKILIMLIEKPELCWKPVYPMPTLMYAVVLLLGEDQLCAPWLHLVPAEQANLSTEFIQAGGCFYKPVFCRQYWEEKMDVRGTCCGPLVAAAIRCLVKSSHYCFYCCPSWEKFKNLVWMKAGGLNCFYSHESSSLRHC